jgi:acetylornithine deacetylase
MGTSVILGYTMAARKATHPPRRPPLRRSNPEERLMQAETTRTLPAAATMDWITRLIGFDTTSRNSNLPLIDAVAAALRELGIEPVLLPNAEGTKANLLATVPAADGTVRGGVVLSGHTDVVPVDGQDWSTDPFVAEVRDGRLYGRGSCDMKSFVGVVLAKMPEIVAAPLREPVHLALSYDEEVGCAGVGSLVEELERRELRPRACVVGEPTTIEVVRGHKAITLLRVTLHGVAAHSALTPQGVNAIEYAAELVRFARSVADEFRLQGPFDEHYTVPFTTASVNRIGGGIAVNTVPAECEVSLEFRAVAGVDVTGTVDRFLAEARRIEAAMQQENPSARVDVEIVASAPGLETAAEAEVTDLVASWGGVPSTTKVSYATEAGVFHAAGIPTVVCGPGDMAQGHTPNEFVALSEIARCEEFLDRFLAQVRLR